MAGAQAAILDVPFVDVFTDMSDPSLPLTTAEYEEWCAGLASLSRGATRAAGQFVGACSALSSARIQDKGIGTPHCSSSATLPTLGRTHA